MRKMRARSVAALVSMAAHIASTDPGAQADTKVQSSRAAERDEV